MVVSPWLFCMSLLWHKTAGFARGQTEQGGSENRTLP